MENRESAKPSIGQASTKPHIGKIKEIEDDVFEWRVSRHVVQLTNLLKNIANYV